MKTNRNGSPDSSQRIKYFDDLAPRWDSIMGSRTDRAQRLQEVFAMIDLPRGGRVIDAGCGTGVLLPLIRERIGTEGAITALDASAVMIETAKKNAAGDGSITFYVTPLETAPLQESCYDAALCFALVPHLDSIPAGLSALRKALVPGGRLYIFHLDDTETLNRFHAGLDAPVKHDLLPGEQDLRALLAGAGFRTDTYIDRPGLNFVAGTAC